MENYEYITFDNNDIIEALEDFYQKKTSKKIDIRFDDRNLRNLKPLRSITIKKSLESSEASLSNTSTPDSISIIWEEGDVKEPYGSLVQGPSKSI